MTKTINEVDLDSLTETIQAVQANRALGEVTFSVNGNWGGGFRVQGETGTITQAGEPNTGRRGAHAFKSDEPAQLLGTDTGASPAEHLLQALAGCFTVTLAASATARGIELEGATVELESDFDLASFLGIAPEQPPGAQEIRLRVTLDAPGASREELESLVELVESRSPILDTLVRPVNVFTNLELTNAGKVCR
jgi:uncharacterized OsmC-like protein